MGDFAIHLNAKTSGAAVKTRIGMIEASKPYFTVFLLVTILLSVWASLCAA
jgi:hypothetical protein